jgi:cytochrome c oxidase subunit 3
MYRLGIFLGCAAIFSFFAALVIAFYWRKQTQAYWQTVPLPRMLWVSTNLILASSISLEAARRLRRQAQHEVAHRFLVVTACLGSAFMASQLTAWRELVRAGVYLAQNPYSSFFYIFTGLHGLHLLGGLIAMFVVVTGRCRRREILDVTAYYWHFLTVLWLVLFTVLFFA